MLSNNVKVTQKSSTQRRHSGPFKSVLETINEREMVTEPPKHCESCKCNNGSDTSSTGIKKRRSFKVLFQNALNNINCFNISIIPPKGMF